MNDLILFLLIFVLPACAGVFIGIALVPKELREEKKNKFKQLDFVRMQIPDEKNIYTNIEGIIAEIDENRLARVLIEDNEIIIPTVLLTKSEN